MSAALLTPNQPSLTFSAEKAQQAPAESTAQSQQHNPDMLGERQLLLKVALYAGTISLLV